MRKGTYMKNSFTDVTSQRSTATDLPTYLSTAGKAIFSAFAFFALNENTQYKSSLFSLANPNSNTTA